VGSAELLDLAFVGGRHHDGEVGRRFLETLLGGDAHFHFDTADERWRIRQSDVLWQSLAEASYVVVDLETTGGGIEESGITEIGAIRVRHGRLEDSFQTLVNPRRPIQPFVVGLTGITDEMVRVAPPIEEVLPDFLAFAGESVLVAHNAAFDLGHLNATLAALGRGPPHLPSLCTLRLARRLLPDLRRRTLDSVAAELGIGVADRHRAMGDARVTAQVLCVFLEQAQGLGMVRVCDLVRHQRLAADGRPLAIRVPPERIESQPRRPGVYHLLDERGRVLYVGRARSLRARLAGYFLEDRDHGRHTLELIRQSHDVATFETGSELAAGLLEARRIRDLRPPFNRLRGHLPRLWFLKLGRGDFPRLWVTPRLSVDPARYLGPFTTARSVETARDLLARAFGLRICSGNPEGRGRLAPCGEGRPGPCLAPCARTVGAAAYALRVTAAQEFLAGGAAPTGVPAGDREALLALRVRLDAIGWVAARRSFAVLVPAPDGGGADFYGVLGGRLAVEMRLGATSDLWVAVQRVREVWDRFHAGRPVRTDVEGMTILAGWLRDRSREGILLPLERVEDLERELDQLTVTLRDLGQRGPLPPIDMLS
jgi:DNA polymerase-3 subunit epsilon